jgi:hypothetical protein
MVTPGERDWPGLVNSDEYKGAPGATSNWALASAVSWFEGAAPVLVTTTVVVVTSIVIKITSIEYMIFLATRLVVIVPFSLGYCVTHARAST